MDIKEENFWIFTPFLESPDLNLGAGRKKDENIFMHMMKANYWKLQKFLF